MKIRGKDWPTPWALPLGVSEMPVTQFSDKVSRLTDRMMAMLRTVAGHSPGLPAPGGLPAGAIHLPAARLIIASTCCTARLFDEQILKVASSSGADVILMRHGLFPETLDAVSYDVAMHIDGQPMLFCDLALYDHPADGFWLVPSKSGPHIAIERDGLRLADEAPYVSWTERCEAVCRAAKRTVLAARLSGGN